MTDHLGVPYEGHVSEILYYRNLQEYSESPTPESARIIFSYASDKGLMAQGKMPLRVLEYPHIERYARMYFYWNRTVVDTFEIHIDPRRHRKNSHIRYEKTVYDVREDYDGYMESTVAHRFINSYKLQTFLKIGDRNDHENIQLWNI
jgi:hypothetical protein